MTLQGVTVRSYGPLEERQAESYLLAWYIGRQRKKETTRGALKDAECRAREIARQSSTSEQWDALAFTPLKRRIFAAAETTAAKTGRAVDQLCREAAERSRSPGQAPPRSRKRHAIIARSVGSISPALRSRSVWRSSSRACSDRWREGGAVCCICGAGVGRSGALRAM